MSDGKVIYDITGDNSGFKQSVNDTEGIAQEGAGKIAGIAGNAAKMFTALATAAVVKGLVDLGKASVEAYAEYEQLVGGVETLFSKSADTVKQYAQDAYMTAGLSANEYMEQVTSFSASLLQSLGGNTAAAADYGNQAVIDMADNANKMGTAIESIQNAYQGFAKGNFTMLDNLKLGYGGTREEMQRLLEDAEKISGIHYDISSFADITQAIHTIQEEMGIAGTTAEEAGSTIQGSIGMVKAAWENLLTGLADPDADIDQLIENLLNSVTTAAENIIPAITTFIVKLIDAITSPENVKNLAIAGGKILLAIVGGIYDASLALGQNAADLVQSIVDGIGQGLKDFWNDIKEAGSNLIEGLIEGVKDKAIALKDSVVNAVKDAWQGVKDFLGIRSPSKLFMQIGAYVDEGLAEGIDSSAETPKRSMRQMVQGITDVSAPQIPTPTPVPAGPAITRTETTGMQGAQGGQQTVVMQVGRIPFGQVTYNSNVRENTVHGVNYIQNRR